MYTTLIRAHELAGHLDDPAWCVMDCRFDLADPEAGHRDWLEGHVPGAFHADLDARLSGPGGPGLGRHPLPDPAALADWLEGCGVDDATQVVCYDADAGAFAARLWWLLRWLGHDAVAVLDGGFAGWCAAGHPVEQAPPAARGRGRLTIRRRDGETRVDAHDIAGDSPLLVVDARAAPRFRGDQEPIDPVAGHVPGARNRPFADNLGAEGCWLPAETLRAEWRRVIGDVPPARVAHMCGSGVTAAHNLLAMEHAGLGGSRLYAGSWSEWITDPARPVERGPAPPATG